MARYRKIDTRIWNDAKFREMSERAQLVFLFALTHPNMTMLGAMRATIPGLAAEFGHDIPEKAFREAFREGLSKGMAKHDEKASLIWFPNFLKYNRPESPNVVKTWSEAFDMLPECAMKGQLFEQLKAFVEGMSKAFVEAFRQAFAEACAKAMPNQEQEQEQEQERTALLLLSDDNKQPRQRPDAFVAVWNENRGTLPRVIELSDDRRKKVQTRVLKGLTVERFTEAVKVCASTPFLTGQNDRKWRATFDWLVDNDSNLLKVLEGKYADGGTPRPIATTSRELQSDPLPPHRDRVISLADLRAKAGIQ
jgi:hypothetical protein